MSQDARGVYDTVVADVTATSPAIASQMFGMPCLKIEGKAFAGYYRESMVFKLVGVEHAQALAVPGAELFDPSGRGRPMKEWVVVPYDAANRWLDMARAALTYVGKGR